MMQWTKGAAVIAVTTLSLVFPKSAEAQKLFKGDNFTITFQSAWDTLGSPGIIAKHIGLEGVATVNAAPGTTLPDIDSLLAFYSDSLGGHITKDSSGTKTIGGYNVHWQKFDYDSLPKLRKLIMDKTKFPVDLKNGSFRVYYLQSNNLVFTLAVLPLFPFADSPYGDVEIAIATLKLGVQAGIISLSQGPGRDLWIRNSKLGGTWLRTNRVFAVDCFDTRGVLIGAATHAAEGSWNLPASHREMFVVLRTADGSTEHFTVRP